MATTATAAPTTPSPATDVAAAPSAAYLEVQNIMEVAFRDYIQAQTAVARETNSALKEVRSLVAARNYSRYKSAFSHFRASSKAEKNGLPHSAGILQACKDKLAFIEQEIFHLEKVIIEKLHIVTAEVETVSTQVVADANKVTAAATSDAQQITADTKVVASDVAAAQQVATSVAGEIQQVATIAATLAPFVPK